jgi:hypothetical protein
LLEAARATRLYAGLPHGMVAGMGFVSQAGFPEEVRKSIRLGLGREAEPTEEGCRAPEPGQNVAPSSFDSISKWTHKYPLMKIEEILAAAAEYFGLDAQEVKLGLRYVAASRQVARRMPHASEHEVKRLSDLARLRSLELDSYQKSQAVVLPKDGLENDAQHRTASQLPSVVQKMQQLQRTLGEPVTERSPLVKKAHSQSMAYYRARREPEPPAIQPSSFEQVAAPASR